MVIIYTTYMYINIISLWLLTAEGKNIFDLQKDVFQAKINNNSLQIILSSLLIFAIDHI